MGKLEALHQQVMLCDQCDLCRQGRMQAVPGEGPDDALIAFYGESPGMEEDEKGRPFVGTEGQFFRGALRSNRIVATDVYLSTTVRCRPPDDRDPLPEEVEACWDWTRQELQALQPRIIITLGKPALMALAHKLGFTKQIGHISIYQVAGKPIFVKNRNFYCFPMLHPTHALRRRDAREDFHAHLKYLKMAIPGWLDRPS
jgi:uracil-DNA glycosylase family 4